MSNVKPIAVLLSDTHLFEKRSRYDAVIDSNYDVVLSAFKKAIKEAKDNDLKYVFHAGDFFDSRKHQSQSLLKMAENIFSLFKDSGIKLVIINGNHDMTSYEDEYSFLSPFKWHPNIIHIEDHSTISVDDVDFHFLSFYENEKYISKLEELKSNLNLNKKNVLITHIGIHGALKNDGEKEKSSITFNMFSEFDKVLIGHYHDYSSHQKGKIVYFGSAIQHNFGETIDKGIVILDSKLHLKRIKTDFKEYTNIVIDISDVKESDFDDLIKQQNDSYQKVTFVGDPTLIKALDKTKLQEAGIKCVVKTEVVQVQEVEQRVEQHSNESILSNFSSFCETNHYAENEGLVYLNKVVNR